MEDQPANGDQESFITTSEAAQRLGISQRTVHYWIQKGVLKSWKTEGGHRRIPVSSIQTLLQRRRSDLEQDDGAVATLLLVEDDEELVDIYQEMVSSWTFPVRLVVAENGFDGLIQVGLCKPDMIISDLIMPAMDGIQMIRTLRETPDLKSSVVVVVTALSDEQIRDRGGLPADVTVFHKPTPFKKIRELAQNLNQQRKSMRLEDS
ncbi:MAG: helix-turn-helix domain-containing protein [Magnetococcales bacterium]|nr:helix-turn-helix domain-containing protein [Magnetococcales bacterium]NGZ26107.1 helix-turn-helix domain-containing protein [Magnetococcales bacterium]